ncbi:Hypothetical protein FKW44_000921 [Caligus rogercresseyi]|uniref:Uncharacterized protein n=1 Tax=Caligus rogercresseyi TaxID=217165 RepID=A0A7T8KI90_CALRO|nr:Hypothetical protein FKW44_000921 [Caligus rogercresseyi]
MSHFKGKMCLHTEEGTGSVQGGGSIEGDPSVPEQVREASQSSQREVFLQEGQDRQQPPEQVSSEGG